VKHHPTQDAGWNTAGSDFSDELGFELHRADAVDLAVDVVITIAQADVLDLGADLPLTLRSLITVMVSPSCRTLPTESFFTVSSDTASASPLADHSWAHSGQISWAPSS
jgi:hypothetical protein